MAASYSLFDLRFLDVLNKTIAGSKASLAIDVFDLGDICDEADWNSYLPNSRPSGITPIVAK